MDPVADNLPEVWDCNRPWVMQLHRAHVSSLTRLIMICARLGLSSTAFVIVSYLFHLHQSP
jgi:hypothetical protein